MMLWGAGIAQLRARLLTKPLLQRGSEARFADARLAGNQRDLSMAAFSALPTPQQQINFLSPSDERGQRSAAQSFEAAFDGAHPQYLPYLGRLAGLGQRDRADRGTIEKATNQAPGGLVDRHSVGLRPCLQSCG